MRLPPRRSRRFAAIATIALLAWGCGDDDPASPPGEESLPGTDGPVFALAADDQFLYVGGAFRQAGSIDANRVVRWDGGDWSSLAPGLDDTVRALTLYRGRPVAGVGGSTIGARTGHVAIFEENGWAWGLDTSPWYVTSLALYRDSIITGTSMGLPATANSFSPLILFDGWSGARQPAWIRGAVTSLGSFGDHLIVGGDFSEAGDAYAKMAARWDGSAWTSMEQGLFFVPRAFATWNDQLVAGGTSGTSQPVSRWVGDSWVPLGGLFNGPVYALHEQNGALYAAGDFTDVGGTAVSNIAWWDGISWSDVGGGLSGEVRALALYGDRLIAGGEFQQAGEMTAQNVAAWNGESWSALEP